MSSLVTTLSAVSRIKDQNLMVLYANAILVLADTMPHKLVENEIKRADAVLRVVDRWRSSAKGVAA